MRRRLSKASRAAPKAQRRWRRALGALRATVDRERLARADTIHILPADDLVGHEESADCVCGPDSLPVPRRDGRCGWVIQHHSLDGREARE